MILTWVCLVAALASGANAARIVGGEPTTIEQYPSIVQLERFLVFFWFQSCGANILNSRYLVSAAHCTDELNVVNLRRVRVGSTYRNTGGTIISVSRIINHPLYRRYANRGLDADITMIELASSLTFSDVIAPVAIPPQGYELPDDLPVVHAGWGDTTENGVASSILRDVTIYTINRELCTERYANHEARPGIVTENMICAGILDVGGKDACQGDSGGPLYFDNILVGVVSWGEGCANDTFPGVSTRVSSYTEWIVEIANN